MSARWLPVSISDFSLKYEVSSLGQVRNAKTGHILTPMRTGTKRKSSQRSKVRFSTHPRRDFDVAHLVLLAFVGSKPEGAQAMHHDDDSSNNEVSNLSWGSLRENMADMARKGRSNKQKLLPAHVRAIVTRRQAGETGASLSREFGVSQQRVCDVYKGRTSFSAPAK